MKSGSGIQILHNSKLDKKKWDDCIERDSDALIYCRSWFLDIIAEDWYGIVIDNYSAILPLPVKNKFGIRFIAMPPFVQQLNIAGKHDFNLFRVLQKEILQFSPFVQFSTSSQQLFSKGYQTKRINYIISLEENYEATYNQYTSSCKKNIAKAVRRGCIIAEDISISDVLNFYRNAYADRSAYTNKHYRLIEKLLNYTKENGWSKIIGVRNEAGTLVYAGALLDDGKRLYYILGAPNENGRQMRATYFFIDFIIKRFTGLRNIFDFEGSDIPNVAKFYQSFSPDAAYYYQCYINQYPFPFNKLIDWKLKSFNQAHTQDAR